MRFGIVGAGNIARTHAAALRATPMASLVGVAGGRAAAAFAAEYDTTAYRSAEELVRASDVDAVILCTPSGARRDLTVLAASHGKHVLVEKPIEVTHGRATAMLDACERHGVTLGVVFQSRFKPGSAAVHTACRAGTLGEVVLGDAYVKWYRPKEYYRSADWRGTWALDGGGALMNQAIHSVDLLLWFLGDVERVFATTRNRHHHDIEVEDTVVAQLEFVEGGLGVIEASTASYPGSPRRIEIQGTDGTVTLVDDEVAEWSLRDGSRPPASNEGVGPSGGESRHDVADHRWHQLQIEDFVAAVREDRRPLVDGREGMRALDVVLAVYASARRGAPVSIDEVRTVHE